MKIVDIIERLVDPALLAQRVASRYGNRTKYGHWEAPIKGQNIPMRSFNSRQADAVYKAYYNARHRLSRQVDQKLPRHDQDIAISELFGRLFRPERMAISSLVATQPFVRIDNPEMLQQKLGNLSKISIATYRGKNYIMDGHHSIVAATLRGDRDIDVNRIDLDNLR